MFDLKFAVNNHSKLICGRLNYWTTLSSGCWK